MYRLGYLWFLLFNRKKYPCIKCKWKIKHRCDRGNAQSCYKRDRWIFDGNSEHFYDERIRRNKI